MKLLRLSCVSNRISFLFLSFLALFFSVSDASLSYSPHAPLLQAGVLRTVEAKGKEYRKDKAMNHLET